VRAPVLSISLLSIPLLMTTPLLSQVPERPIGPVAQNRLYELEHVDTTAVVQLYADGFDQLSLGDKQLCYHLAQAAIAGRDINLDQRFAFNLAIRSVLESLILVYDALPAEVAREVARYTKLFWVHNGVHNNLSTRKELLRLSWEQFEAACKVAQQQGHDLSAKALAPAGDLRQIHGILTDPKTFVSCTNKSPDDGADPLASSCNNLYVGLALADFATAKEQYPLDSRAVKGADGKLQEQVYRCGDGKGIAPGLYAVQLAKVNDHLRAALPFAPPKTRAALERLIRYDETGDPADWRAYNIAWVADQDSVVDVMMGFVEVYLDVRGQKGSWQSVVSFRNEHKTHEIEALAKQAQWFEDRMPWESRYRKQEVKGISARAISVIIETGDTGPITPVGVNLPNEADIRQDYGSKSVNLSNVVEAYNATSATSSAAEFSFTKDEADRAARYAPAMDDVHTNLHEVIGHASGQVLPEVQNPAQSLGLQYSTLEEARADLVGLYWIADQKLKDLGLVPDAAAVLAKYDAYARNALTQLRRVPKGQQLEEDHMRNRQLIVHWLIANSDAIKTEHKDGKTFYHVTGIAAFQQGCGALLAEVMRIKATGDGKAGKELVDKYGTKVDPLLHGEVLARVAKLRLPSVTGFVQPELDLVKDQNGVVTDVKVRYPMDLADQMLRWSGRR